MRVQKSIFFILLFFCFSIVSNSQQILESDSIKDNLEDSVLIGVQNYKPGTGQFFYPQFLGNVGLAFRNRFIFESRSEFYYTGIDQFNVYEYLEKEIKGLSSKHTFSQLKYFNGSKREQNFSIKHFQKLSRVFSFGLDFRTTNSDGFYTNQKSNVRNFNFYLSLTSVNKKYNLLLNYLSNRIISQENGGLINDAAFETSGSINTQVTDVNFNDVSNKHKSKVVTLEHEYDFITKGTDSLNLKKNKQILLLKNIFKYSRKEIIFAADKFYPDYFDNIYYDSTKTYDSLFVQDFYTDLSLNFKNNPTLNNFFKGKTSFYLRGDYQLYNYNQNNLDTLLNNTSISPGGSIEWGKGYGLDAFYKKDVNDLKFNYYKMYLGFHIKPENKNRKILITLENEKRNADFIYSYYDSNHFIWFNQFNPLDFSKVSLSVETKMTKQFLNASLNFYSVKNLTYFDFEGLPAQFSDKTSVIIINLFHSIKSGKFNLINNFKIQHAEKKEIIQLPALATYTSFFYENSYFKKSLTTQFGFDLRYCTKYFADAYMPATGQFYLQDEKKIGNYPYVDLFVNFGIHHAKIFFKLEHVNAGLMGRAYYLVPHYPMPGRSFKFGIIWDLYD